jgi:DNA-nicking Smr family endonuclease
LAVCVRVIHGKGLGSPGKTPVLKAKTLAWLIQKMKCLLLFKPKPIKAARVHWWCF